MPRTMHGGRRLEGEKMQDTETQRPIDELLTAEQAADLLGLKVATVRRMTNSRDLPCVRPTGKRCVRYSRSDLEALIRMRSQPMRMPEAHVVSGCADFRVATVSQEKA